MSTNDEMQTASRNGPGLRDGKQSELTLIANVKPGHAAALREALTGGGREELRQQGTREVGTVHNYRSVLFDNDTRFLFATVFDGPWDVYLDDFGASPLFSESLNEVLSHTEGFPGYHHPDRNDWMVAHWVPSAQFTSAYGDLTVKQVWKDQRISEAFQAVLDTPEFQEAVKDPAYAKLVATPAFQKLLDEAAS